VWALGVAVARWVPDYFRTPKRGIAGLLDELADKGDLLRTRIEGWEEPAYVHPDNAELAEAVISGELRPSLTTLLSPFDPVVWDRARASELFGFEYRIEVYTSAAVAGTGTTRCLYCTTARCAGAQTGTVRRRSSCDTPIHRNWSSSSTL
jgi:uncharacterized protein YcaQ